MMRTIFLTIDRLNRLNKSFSFVLRDEKQRIDLKIDLNLSLDQMITKSK